jgi:hypothetical protein
MSTTGIPSRGQGQNVKKLIHFVEQLEDIHPVVCVSL